MKFTEKLRAKSEAGAIEPMPPSETKARLHYLSDALECMDARVTSELERLTSSGADEDIKEFVRQDILSRHELRRLPLQTAVEELRAEYQANLSDISKSQMTVEVTRPMMGSPARAVNG